MRFGLLGPLSARIDGVEVPFPGPRLVKVLAALLVETNRVVPIQRLVDVMWDDDPPATAVRQVQDAVSVIRRTLAAHGAPPTLITTSRAGYQIDLDIEQLDLLEFQQDRRAAEAAAVDPADAVAALRRALGRWRGPALIDVTSRVLENVAARLDAERLAAHKSLLGIELTLGHHSEVVEELTALLHEQPLDEQIAEYSILALYRSGRQSEALKTYQTTRERLAEDLGIDPAPPLQELHSAQEAHELLTRRLGADRVTREQGATAQLIELCARLPLALNIVAARAIARPTTPLATLATEIHDAQTRLDALASDPIASVRTVLSWSYRTLDDETARMFRLLGLHQGPDISVPAAASLAGITVEQADHALEVLVTAHLLSEPAPGRYTFHDLVRLYAAEQAEEEPGTVRTAAAGRLASWYIHTARRANVALMPTHRSFPLPVAEGAEPLQFDSYDQGLEWFDQNWENLGAGVRVASTHERHELAWKLAVSQRPYCLLRRNMDHLIDIFGVAIDSARALGDHRVRGQLLDGLSVAHRRLGHMDQSESFAIAGLEAFRTAGESLGEAVLLTSLATVYIEVCRFDEAIALLDQALAINREVGQRHNEVITLTNKGLAQSRSGRRHEAIATYREALALQGDDLQQGYLHGNIAEAHRALGRYDLALDGFRTALAMFEQVDDRPMQAERLRDIGDVLQEMERTEEARKAWGKSHALYEELGMLPEAADVAHRLS